MIDIARRFTAALACAAFVVTIASCAHAPKGSADFALRVMTYNIAAGHGDLNATAATIRAASADIVALQEVDVHWEPRSNFADQATELGRQLNMQVRFAPIYHVASTDASKPPREYGVALLSRFPIVDFHNHQLTRLSTQTANASPAPMPGFLEVSVKANGQTLRVFNTHLDYRADPSVRRQQVSETLAILGTTDTPMLFFGDLNATPTAPELAPLLARLHDAWPTSSDAGLSYPANAPVKRIDYVLTSSHFRVVSASVTDVQTSDHRPVVASLSMSRSAR